MESILSIVFLILLAQAPEAAIEGVVVRAGTSEPLSKATVELRRAEGNGTHSYVTTTGSDGRFFLRNVQPGQYRLVATRDAYVRAEYGQRGPNAAGSPITVTAGQQMRNVQMAMTPTGTIYGRVYDRAGRPAVNATVQALRSSYQEGRRVPKLVQSTLTNDLGEYRLFWLAPGFYYINATPSTAGSNDQVPQPITNPDAPPDDLGGFVGGVMFGSRTGVLRPHEADGRRKTSMSRLTSRARQMRTQLQLSIFVPEPASAVSISRSLRFRRIECAVSSSTASQDGPNMPS